MLEHLDFGSRLVWVIDPASRPGTVYRSRRDAVLVAEDEELDGGETIPGFPILPGDVLPG